MRAFTSLRALLAVRSRPAPRRFYGTVRRARADPQRIALSRPISQPTAYTHPHLMSDAEVTPGISRAEYAQRRQRLSAALPPRSLCVFPSNTQRYMSEDVPFLYHHNADLMYVCGVLEPGAVLIVEKGEQEAVYTLFVEKRDATRELWDGPLCGAEEDVQSYFGVDQVFARSELMTYVQGALGGIKSFHYDSHINDSVSASFAELEPKAQGELVDKWDQEKSPKIFLLSQRLVKSEAECVLLRKAGRIMAESLNETMGKTMLSSRTDAVEEKYIEASLEYGCKSRGSQRMAFPSVVASGVNGTILHYMSNNCRAVRGDFVMVDAGCEVYGYCSDVSRSWPISGRFSGAQKDFYELVLGVQKKCIAIAREGAMFGSEVVSMDRMHLLAVRDLTDGLLQLGFMKGHSLESAISTGAYATYFPHATGHYLGMDVHDTHRLPKNLPLRQDMVVTVEPGLYCPANDASAPAAFRGLGMRIEDDIIVGGAGRVSEVISGDASKEVFDIEALVGSSR